MEKCSTQGCEAPANGSRGLCHAHYRRLRLLGDTKPEVPVSRKRPGRPCAVEACDRVAQKRDLCSGHYQRWAKTGDPGSSPLASRAGSNTPCSVNDCDNKATAARGWCHTHYERWRRTGTPTPEPRRPQGHKRITKQGYVLVHSGGCAPVDTEHRLMWEARYGPLLPGQNVHHKNGNRADNRYENFEIWDTTQPAGQRPEDKVEFAIQMLERYAPHRLS